MLYIDQWATNMHPYKQLVNSDEVLKDGGAVNHCQSFLDL